MPSGKPFFTFGNRKIGHFPGFRIKTTNELIAEVRVPNHAVAIQITSWGMASFRGRSYSVMIVRVALPLGRGNVFSGKLCLEL